MAAEPLTVSVFVEAPPEHIYEYFTRGEAIVRWMGEYAVSEPTPGCGTRVELEHRDLPDEQRHGHPIGWGHYLARPQLVGGRNDSGPDPGM